MVGVPMEYERPDVEQSKEQEAYDGCNAESPPSTLCVAGFAPMFKPIRGRKQGEARQRKYLQGELNPFDDRR